MNGWLNRFFKLEENRTSVRTEMLGGITTFMTMSYIIFVQPAILSVAGMDRGAVLVATCISSAVATLLMGLIAKYPIALAPAMGHNIFFAVIVCGAAPLGMGYSWQVALGAVFISGIVFIVLSLFGFWGKLVSAVPDSLKHSIAVGIGLLIALIGLEYGGIVVDTPDALPGTTDILVMLGDLTSKHVLLVLFGVAVISILMGLKVRGAILVGIMATAVLGIPLGIVKFHGIISAPPSVLPTLFKLDVFGAFRTGLITVIFVFFFLDLFDTIGTLMGVSGSAGFLKEGRLPRANQAMLSDAIGTVSGAFLGTSTVTSYIESTTGISQGARTGLANIFTSLLFLLALFFSPLAEMIGGEYLYTAPRFIGGEIIQKEFLIRPVIAPPLIIVGYLMMRCVAQIDWEDLSEAIPAFLTIIIMPLTFSITEGIAFGFIAYSMMKLVTGKGKQVHWIIYVFAVLFVVRYIIK